LASFYPKSRSKSHHLHKAFPTAQSRTNGQLSIRPFLYSKYTHLALLENASLWVNDPMASQGSRAERLKYIHR
jgi:hypothetical protein